MKKKLTSLLLALCMVIAMLPSFTIDLTAFAAEIASTDPSDDWEYTTNADGTVTLTSYTGTAADVYIPSTVTDSDGNRLTVTALGDGVFKGNTGINSATLGEGITTIGASAFEGAVNLVCIVSPETLTTIGDRAFYGCSVFNSVILYDAVTSIGTDAFAECPSATVWVNENSTAHTYAVDNGIKYEIMNADAEPEIYVIDDVEYYIQNGEAIVMGAPDEKTGELVIPPTINNYPVTRITDSAFNGSQLTKISLPDTIKVLGDSAFANTSLLESINIPNGVTEIPGTMLRESAVSGELTIPDGVKIIGGWSFFSCDNLTAVHIPEGVEIIYNEAFRYTPLKEVVIPHSVATVHQWAFGNNVALVKATLLSCETVLSRGTFDSCSFMTTLVVPEGSKQLQTLDVETNWHIFYKCNSFSNIETTIEGWVKYPFFVCRENTKYAYPSYDPVNWNLYVDGKLVTDLVIPEGVTEIADKSFQYCNNAFKSLTIPRSVKKIGRNTITQTTITDYYLESDGTVVANAFINTTPKNIYTDSWESLSNFKWSTGAQYTTVYKTENLYINGEAVTEYIVPENQTETGVFGAWLEKITLHNKVTKIGNSSFSGCTKLKEINIPDSVTQIGNSAFSNCTSLEKLELSNNIKSIGTVAFSGCVFKELVVPDSITEIPDYAFQNVKIENLYLPKKITHIGNYAFRDAELQNVHITSYDVFSDTTMSDLAVLPLKRAYNLYVSGVKTDEFVVPESMNVIPNGIFAGPWLRSIRMHDNVTEVSSLAFSNSQNLADIVWSKSLKTIGSYAFSSCTALHEVKLPYGIISIGNRAFHGSGVAEITIPGSVELIDECAFLRCENLKKATIEDGAKVIGRAAFEGCTELEELYVPDSVTEIGEAAFCETKIKEFRFPANCTIVNRWTFRDCYYLKKIIIPEGINTIYGFSRQGTSASGIEVYMPKSATFIDEEAICWPYASQMKWYVYEGSYAHKFAELKKFNFEILPDDSEPEIDISHLTYTIADGAVKITKCATTYMGILEIPAEIEGFPVKTIGNSSFNYCNDISQIILPEGIETIENWAFTSCDSLQKISLPSTLKTIGTGAFWGCGNLRDITIPEGVTTLGARVFEKCDILRTITLPESVTQIDVSAFKECELLNTVNLGSKVETIGEAAFYGCKNLQNITLPETVKSIGAEAFYNCAYIKKLTLSDDITHIYNHTFYGTSRLAEINLPKNLVVLGDAAFQGSGIKSAVIPEGITTISPSLFSGCASLESVTLHDGITDISSYAFYKCSSLCGIDLPGSLNTIGDSAFAQSSKLSEITVPSGVSSLGASSFAGTAIKNATIPEAITNVSVSLFNGCTALESVELHDNVTSIGDSAFNNCTALTRAKLSENLNSIGTNAFNGCGALLDIDIPDSVTTIGAAAFKNCTNASLSIPKKLASIGDNAYNNCDVLTDIVIPANVTAIPDFAFANCDNLRKIIAHDNVTSIGEHSFMGSSKAILWVYDGSYAHTYAQNNNVMYFVMHKTGNPEVYYGTELTGTVTLDGSPASGAEVSLLYDDGVVKETVTTDDTGAYTFTYAEVGEYTIRAASGTVSGTEKISVKRMNAFDVFLAGETDIVLKNSWTVSGAVSPALATVTLTDMNGNIIESTDVTDGAYSFANVPNGSYIIKAETENGTAVKEITVFNADVTVEAFAIEEVSTAIITGTVDIEDRSGGRHKKVWVDITLYNEDGIAITHTKTKEDGTYTFDNVSMGNYSLVAETEEMRTDKKKGFERSHKLTGFAYVEVTEPITYTVDITSYEENDSLATISGKVTAQGETQDCEVTLANVFRHEVASCRTGKNGKYTFTNVRDGMYFVTARTEKKGMGFTVVVVRNGKVHGETDIHVWRHEKFDKHEKDFDDFIKGCTSPETAKRNRERIAEEKRWYDSLSEKEKKHCSKDYVDRLNEYCRWISDCENTGNGGRLENGEQLLSGDELEGEDTYEFILDIAESQEVEVDEKGIKNKDQYNQKQMEDTAGKKHIAKYYDIKLSKKDSKGNCHEIKSVARDTDTTGKVRITMDIPEEYRGHKHYHFVHIHNGEPMTLIDLDDDPNTITFEVDRFSTFALTYTDEVLSVDGEVEEEEVGASNFGDVNAYIRNISYTDENGATRYRIILLAAIDALSYREVGFEITANGKTRSDGTKTVYSSVMANNSDGNVITVTPSNFGGNAAYIFAQKYTFSDIYKDAVVTFRPYAIDFSGSYIYGKETTIDAIYNK